MRRLLPLLLALIGLLAGGGAGFLLRPVPEAGTPPPARETPEAAGDQILPEYVRMNNQFIVPVVESGRIASVVILSLSIEVAPGGTETVYAREPKIRDAFLSVLFDHANAGGFRGAFTDAANLVFLRRALTEAAQTIIGPAVSDVLITDIARQDS